MPTPMAVNGSLEAECQEGNGSPEENWILSLEDEWILVTGVMVPHMEMRVS